MFIILDEMFKLFNSWSDSCVLGKTYLAYIILLSIAKEYIFKYHLDTVAIQKGISNPPKTEVWTLFPNFYTANILFWEHLGVICFRPKNQFLKEKEPTTLSHGQGTHSAKIVLIVWPKIPQTPQKISAQFVWPSPKVSNFWKKALSGCP